MNSFVLDLPVHQKEEFTNIESTLTTRHSQNESSILSFDKKAPLILAAEDNKELADFIFSELSESYNVVLAKNGEEATKLIEKQEI